MWTIFAHTASTFCGNQIHNKAGKVSLASFLLTQIHSLSFSLSISITYGLMSRWRFSVLKHKKITHTVHCDTHEHTCIQHTNTRWVWEKVYIRALRMQYHCMLFILCLLYTKQVKSSKAVSIHPKSFNDYAHPFCTFEKRKKRHIHDWKIECISSSLISKLVCLVNRIWKKSSSHF